jgi:tRNA uridine 5-carboxymethylaminomethyl modification enzyme
MQSLALWSGPSPDAVPIDDLAIAIQYGAFIEKERKEAERHKANEYRRIPDDLDYSLVTGLRVEASQQLAATRPPSVGHAARTAGVTPSDIGALLVHLTRLQT